MPIYLRVTNPIFINGTMNDCVLLYDLIKALHYGSFASTQRRYEAGEIDIDPYNSLRQQPYVKLTPKAVEWLEPRFQEAINRMRKVDGSFIDGLPQTDNNFRQNST